MTRQTRFRILASLIISYSLLANLNAQSWQFTKKLGSDKKYTPNDVPVLLDKLKDSKGNHYLYYYITGDTFYYDDFSHKRYLRGGDGYALCKIRCDGSIAWSKIFTHDRKNKVDLYQANRAALFFGDNENRIVISGRSYTGGSNFYIDSDTTIGSLKEYTIVYDSNGIVVKKFIDKPKNQGRSIAKGFFPSSNRYFHYTYIDSSATDRTFYKGKYLQWGEYFIVMDSNMNYLSISPVTLFSKSRFTSDSSEPLELTFENPFLFKFYTINHKAILLNWQRFDPSSIYTGQYAAVGRDTLRVFDKTTSRAFSILMCYNDNGSQEWTQFAKAYEGGALYEWAQDGSEIFLKRDEIGICKYKNIDINCNSPSGNYQTVVFKIDSNGNFLWKDSLEYESVTNNLPTTTDVSSLHELVWSYHLLSSNSWPKWFRVGNKQYQNNTPTPSASNGYTKNLIVAVGKGTQRVIDTTTEGIRRTLTSHVSVDAADNVWLFGSKNIDGRILNNDSTPLQYGTGNDLFIAKHGQTHCFCDPLVSIYKVTDSSIEGRISVQYTGSATDSVVFLWGDGTHSVAKPSTTLLTKIYNKTISASIAAVAYNNCYRTDTFRRTIQIKCTPPNAEFSLLDSNTKNIRVKYIGTATDTVTYHWGDGNTTKLANPLNKIKSYNYTTSVDSVYISASIKSVCGDRDTFGRWYVFCPKQKKSFILDTSKLSSRILSVQYLGADSLWVDWGDDTKSYKPNGIKIYNSYGVYTVSIIIKSSCGRLDTTKYVLIVGTSGIENNSGEDIVISPNPVNDFLFVVFPATVIPAHLLGSQQQQTKITITMTNLLGQSFSPPVVIVSDGFSLDVRALSEGVYILQIRDIMGSVVKTEKVIISREK